MSTPPTMSTLTLTDVVERIHDVMRDRTNDTVFRADVFGQPYAVHVSTTGYHDGRFGHRQMGWSLTLGHEPSQASSAWDTTYVPTDPPGKLYGLMLNSALGNVERDERRDRIEHIMDPVDTNPPNDIADLVNEEGDSLEGEAVTEYEAFGCPLTLTVSPADTHLSDDLDINARWEIGHAPGLEGDIQGPEPDGDYFITTSRTASLPVDKYDLFQGVYGPLQKYASAVRSNYSGTERNDVSEWGDLEFYV